MSRSAQRHHRLPEVSSIKFTDLPHGQPLTHRFRVSRAFLGFLPRFHLDRWPVWLLPHPRFSFLPVPSCFCRLIVIFQFAKTKSSNAHYPPHSHSCLTTHLIRRGTLTIMYPKDDRPVKQTFGVGDRVDVDARRTHEVWMGDEGCEYVIGEV